MTRTYYLAFDEITRYRAGVPIEEIRDRLELPDLPDTEEAVEAAIAGALDTDLLRDYIRDEGRSDPSDGDVELMYRDQF